MILQREHGFAGLFDRRLQGMAVGHERGQLGAGPGDEQEADEEEQQPDRKFLERVVALHSLVHRSTPAGSMWSMAAVLAPLRCSAALNEATGSSSGWSP